jgi:hypothetical protein
MEFPPSPDSAWFFPFFVLFWLAITGLLALIGGWRYLAFRFPATDTVEGEKFRFVSGSMGRPYFPVNYGSCLFVTVGRRGFRLSIFFPFRPLSPPLFFPWSSIESIDEKRFLFMPHTVIGLRDCWPTLSLYGKAGKRVREAYLQSKSHHP